MRSFVLFYTSLTFFVNAIFLSIVIRWYYMGLIAVSAVCIVTHKLLSKKKDIDTQEAMEIGEGLDIENPDQPIRVDVRFPFNVLNLGFLGVGSPGSGKSVFTILLVSFNQLKRSIGGILFDGKGDKDVYQMLAATGIRIDRFFSTELNESDSVNIIEGDEEEIIEATIQALVENESPYYRSYQSQALRTMIPLLVATGKSIVLRDVFVVLTNDEAALQLIDELEVDGVSEVAEYAKTYLAEKYETRRDKLSGLLSNMSVFVNGKLAERLNCYTPTLSLRESAAKNHFVYMHMPYTDKAKRVGIFLHEQIASIARHRQLYDNDRKPWPVICDDWGKFFYENSGANTARARSANMQMSYLFQSYGQTDSIDRWFTTETMDNIGTLIGFKINGIETGKRVAEEFGTYESNEMTATSFGGESFSVIDRPKVKPEQIKNLNAGEAFVSTFLTGEGGQSAHKQYKVRFPLPPQAVEPDSIDWPSFPEMEQEEDEGLHLWDKYMSSNRLASIREELTETLAQRDVRFNEMEVNDPL